MDLNITSTQNSLQPVRIGWFLSDEKSSIIMYPPTLLQNNPSQINDDIYIQHARQRYAVIRCPFDINIGFQRDKSGKPQIVNLYGTSSPIRSNKLANIVHLVDEIEWRYPDKPILQLSLPYCFIAEETCYITQLDTFDFYRSPPLPGTIFGGRFPIHSWVRPLMWAFEWHDVSKNLLLKRGEPLFYVQFELDRPDRQIDLVRAKKTADVERWMLSMQGVASMVNQTFSLFKASEANRPKNLIILDD